jgi:cytochrome c peroxidase
MGKIRAFEVTMMVGLLAGCADDRAAGPFAGDDAMLAAKLVAAQLAGPSEVSDGRDGTRSPIALRPLLEALEITELDAVVRRLALGVAVDALDLRALRGAVNFFTPLAGGNGRSCGTCHEPGQGFSLTPERAEARWQALMRRRETDPYADDPLFRAIDADDGVDDFTLLRTRGLIKVRVPLPDRVRLADDPTATSVTVSRAVPGLNMLAHTAPYPSDRTATTLEQQALGAVHAHMDPSAEPSLQFLESLAEFQRRIFSSAKVRRLSRAIERGEPPPDVDPELDPIERLGKERFEEFCGKCHGGPAQVENRENRIFPPFDGTTNPLSLNVGISNPLPAGFPPSPIHGPEHDLPALRFEVDLPNGSRVELSSSDPGTVLTDERALETVAGNQVFNRFDIPQLRGIRRTAPYFHDHRARTLEEVVRHYQAFFLFINTVRGLPLPLIPDEDIAPMLAYMERAL